MSTDELLRDDARTAGIATLVELLDHRVARQGDELVFRFVSGDGTEEGALTFRALRARAQAIAAGLRAHADPGDRVVLLVPPGLDYVASFFGCLSGRGRRRRAASGGGAGWEQLSLRVRNTWVRSSVG